MNLALSFHSCIRSRTVSCLAFYLRLFSKLGIPSKLCRSGNLTKFHFILPKDASWNEGVLDRIFNGRFSGYSPPAREQSGPVRHLNRPKIHSPPGEPTGKAAIGYSPIDSSYANYTFGKIFRYFQIIFFWGFLDTHKHFQIMFCSK